MPQIAIPNDPSALWIVAAVILLSAAAGWLLIRRVFQLLDANSAAATTAVNNVINHFKEAAAADRIVHQTNVSLILADHKESVREICTTHREVVTEMKQMKGGVESLTNAIREHSHQLADLHSHVKVKTA